MRGRTGFSWSVPRRRPIWSSAVPCTEDAPFRIVRRVGTAEHVKGLLETAIIGERAAVGGEHLLVGGVRDRGLLKHGDGLRALEIRYAAALLFQEVEAAAEWELRASEVLEQAAQRVILADGGYIRSEHLPGTLPRRPEAATAPDAAPESLPPGGISLDAIERSLVVQALTQARYNKTRAAKLLGLTRAQLYSRIEKYGLAETKSS